MSLGNRSLIVTLTYVFFLSLAFAWVESSVVVYLRAIYYPMGFHFPIKRHYDLLLVIELIREFATIIIMISLSALLSKKFWEGFAYFLIIFGIWDIFFYVWLKVSINWPDSLFTPDILFLIPIPWIAPVLSPILVSLVMIIIGVDLLRFYQKGILLKPKLLHWIFVLTGTVFILYTYMCDIDAGFHEKYPQPYNWLLFSLGITLYLIAQTHLHRYSKTKQ